MPKLANDNYGALVCDSITRVVRCGGRFELSSKAFESLHEFSDCRKTIVA